MGKRRKGKRRQASRRLPKLMEMYGNTCYWCKQPIVLLRSIYYKNIIEVKPRTVVWKKKNEIITMRRASVDHVLPLSKGGSNDMSNLVPACIGCNHGRNDEDQWEPEKLESIEELTTPPIIGETYLVPCALRKVTHFQSHSLPARTELEWTPILRPHHEDFKYLEKRTIEWKENGDGEFYAVEESSYYPEFIDYPHHYHVDARFMPEGESFPPIFQPDKYDIEFRVLKCVRPQPRIPIFLGTRFINDFKHSKINCDRCPHKGTLLNSMPVVDGIITCPAHGLKFNAKTKECFMGTPTNPISTQ